MKISGGFQVDSDNRLRGTFTHNPSTLRLSMHSPNLMQIPRGDQEQSWVKDVFVAPEGKVFVERDFSAIEAVLVGYFAGSPSYVRFAKLGVHDYLTSHMIQQPADLSLSDTELKAYFKAIKKEHPKVRDAAKRVVHGSNYLMSPKRMFELYPEFFPSTKDAAKLQGLYFELFPEIKKWHFELCRRVDGTKRKGAVEEGEFVDPWTLGVCYVKNPFGYTHHFYSVLDWERVDNVWMSTLGDDAKRCVAFLPQSTAAAIIKKAAKRIFYEYPWAGEHLRLLIHDSIMFECPEKDAEMVLRVSQDVMEAALPELPLDPSWGLGEYLSIGTEAKVGKVWSEMN